MRAGKYNLITDVAGLRVGHSQDEDLKSGTSVLLADEENVASAHVMGGAPGTRDIALLQPENTVQSVDALVLSGGSAFGLDAAGGVQAALREQGKGFLVGDQRVPIVPAAIIFDLINGGNKNWSRFAPYRDLGYEAVATASKQFQLGSVGAGTGAIVGGPGSGIKGGLGSASTVMPNGVTVGAMVVVNALGAPTVGNSKHFWAAPFEIDNEFGALGIGNIGAEEAQELRIKFRETQNPRANTTIAIIATDAELTKGEAKRLAIAAHDGFARALWPAHTSFDGDLIFSIATGKSGRKDDMNFIIDLGPVAAATMSRAIARGIYEASTAPGDVVPTWSASFT